MIKVLSKVAKYWHTLRHLRLIQGRYRIKNTLLAFYSRRFPHRVKKSLLRRLPEHFELRANLGKATWFVRPRNSEQGMFSAADILNGRFMFLHRSKEFVGAVEWSNPEFTYLWDFNLHYFDYLCALGEGLGSDSSGKETQFARKMQDLIEGWIDCNPPPLKPGWHPYTVSLRTINWIKVFVNYPDLASEKARRSLYLQLLFLEKNLECHLMVNHLLENGRALLFGGIFFKGADAQRWLKMGLRILRQEVVEEILPGGGHFERSPMYHCIVLEGLLDTRAYLSAGGFDTSWLDTSIAKMCDWLSAIRCPDNTFPLFNDAAHGISATPDDLLHHATRLIGYRQTETHDCVRNCDQLFVLESPPFFCVVDGAPIGPSYNPGHAHSDNLTYELFVNGRRLVVDVGVYGYDPGKSRQYYRSTASHNTVVVNGLEQSEVWGGFRVARRSNPTLSRATQCGRTLIFQGEYLNRVDSAQRIKHERFVVIRPESWFLVWDVITAVSSVEAVSHCHFGPGWQVSAMTEGYLVQHECGDAVYCYPIDTTNVSVAQAQHAPEFGKELTVSKLEFRNTGEECVQSGYLFCVEPLPVDSKLRVKCAASGLELTIGNESEPIELHGAFL